MNELGPYKLNQIYCGDCAILMQEIPNDCIDLTVTSPPYGNMRNYKGFIFDFEIIAQQLVRITKIGGVLVWVVGDSVINGSETGSSFKQALYYLNLGFNLHDTMIYGKINYPPQNNNRYEQQFEYMFVFSKGIPTTFNPIMIPTIQAGKRRSSTYRQQDGGFKDVHTKGRYKSKKPRSNIWFYGTGKGHTTLNNYAFAHPAMFPEALAHDHILSWSNPNDVVFDPLVGSGTTCKMAKEAGRRWLGFDISEEYVALAQKRVAQARTPLFV